MGQSLGHSQRHAGFQRGPACCRAYLHEHHDSHYHSEHERYLNNDDRDFHRLYFNEYPNIYTSYTGSYFEH